MDKQCIEGGCLEDVLPGRLYCIEHLPTVPMKGTKGSSDERDGDNDEVGAGNRDESHGSTEG